MKKTFKTISVFDGISCARVALDKLGYKDVQYYSSEVDKPAMAIAGKNWPETIQLGDIKSFHRLSNPKTLTTAKIDLLIGGSPCQDLSIAGKRKGLAGARSGLFYDYVRILKEQKPKYFVLENVNSMPKEARDVITKELGVEPIMIDAQLVSAQVRKRLFWTNIPKVTQPADRKIILKDIIHETRGEKFDLEKYKIKETTKLKWIKRGTGGKTGLYLVVPEATKKGFALAEYGDSVDISFPSSKTRRGRVGKKAKNLMTSSTIAVVGKGYIRKLTPIECERLQGLPDNYTEGQSETQRYKALGNAFNTDVVAHILSFIPKK